MRNIIIAASLAVIVTGCASAGNERIRAESSATVSQKLVRGSTTKAQVKGAFGDPLAVSFTDSGNEVWTYEHTVARPKPVNFVPYVNLVASGANVEKKSLVVFFNKAGIVQNYALSDSKGEVRQGLGAL
ncbi:outer membrane protein assembly factor BamE domain-containing protein [Labrys neptuniae]